MKNYAIVVFALSASLAGFGASAMPITHGPTQIHAYKLGGTYSGPRGPEKSNTFVPTGTNLSSPQIEMVPTIPVQVPEPATLSLLGLGLVGLGAAGRRRKRA